MFFLTPYNKKSNKTFYDLVDDFFNDSFFDVKPYQSFKLDVKEFENEYIVEAELPGIKKEEIKLECNDDNLMISVQRENKIDEEKENYIHKERRMSSMQRCFYLKDVDNERIEAKLEDGILKIVAPKRENVVNKRLIDIK